MLLDRNTIALLRYAHGAFNLLVLLMLCRQALLGFRARRARKMGAPDRGAVRAHRRLGPLLAFFVPAGLVAGFTLVFLDRGRFFEFPWHAATGIVLATGICSTFLISRRITAATTGLRDLHAAIGRVLLATGGLQLFFGLGALL